MKPLPEKTLLSFCRNIYAKLFGPLSAATSPEEFPNILPTADLPHPSSFRNNSAMVLWTNLLIFTAAMENQLVRKSKQYPVQKAITTQQRKPN